MIDNLGAGHFVNVASNYYMALQQINTQGTIISRTHFVAQIKIETINFLELTMPLDPNVFAFFKGVNTPASPDALFLVPVDAGLPASTHTASNH